MKIEKIVIVGLSVLIGNFWGGNFRTVRAEDTQMKVGWLEEIFQP